MNHLIIYQKIIKKAKNEVRIKHNGIYYENHHILPKCLNGDEKDTNKVLLTAKEHFLCHKLLTYIYPNDRKIACAYHKMAFSKNKKCHISSRNYAYARELISSIPMSEETRKKLSKAGQRPSLLKGTTRSKEVKYKIGKKLKGRIFSEEHKNKLRLANLGEKNPMYAKTTWKKGTHLSDQQKQHLRGLYLGKTYEQLYGIEKTLVIKQKISKNLKGKTLGIPCSDETKKKISDIAKIRFEQPAARKKISESTRLAMQRPEVKEKIRLAMIKRKEKKINS